jgi:ribosome-binding factor A
LQNKISERIDTRYTPRLQFHLDEGVKKSLAISQMLKELLPEGGDSNEENKTSETDRWEDKD